MVGKNSVVYTITSSFVLRSFGQLNLSQNNEPTATLWSNRDVQWPVRQLLRFANCSLFEFKSDGRFGLDYLTWVVIFVHYGSGKLHYNIFGAIPTFYNGSLQVF